jgi:hypothetical protein
MGTIAKCLALAVALGGAASPPAAAQVVREDGVKSIAGVPYSVAAAGVASAEWTFRSAGGEVLFASLEADICRIMEDHHEDAATRATQAGKGGECRDDDGGPGNRARSWRHPIRSCST